jgi:hypothetical protein
VGYYKGYIALSDNRDVPMLLTIRNARAITFDQICALALIEGYELRRSGVQRRLSRLERFQLVRRLSYGQVFSQPVFAITSLGIEFLESRGHALASLSPNAKQIVPRSQILHSVQLAGIRVALAKKGILRSWTWELEIVSRNIVSGTGTVKDYDALVEVSVDGERRVFAIELERTLKCAARYEELCRVFDADQTADRVLYLAPGADILYVLALELRATGKQLGFALSRSFQSELLDARVVTNYSGNETLSVRQFLLQ